MHEALQIIEINQGPDSTNIKSGAHWSEIHTAKYFLLNARIDSKISYTISRTR